MDLHATQEHRLQGGALCIWALVQAIHHMDINDVILQEGVATEIRDLFQEHLLHWQGLCQTSLVQKTKRWKIRPKHHSLEEMGWFTYHTRINPRVCACFQDESYLGALKRVGTKCHEATVLTRTFQRVLLLLAQRWNNTRRHARQS